MLSFIHVALRSKGLFFNYRDMHVLMDVVSDTDESSSDEDMEYDFNRPFYVRLPDFLDTNKKWNDCIYDTKDMELFEVLVQKILALNYEDEEKKAILEALAENLVLAHWQYNAFFEELMQHHIFH